MSSGTRWSMLNLIKPELDEALATIQSHLEAYLEEPAEDRRQQASQLLWQVWGALNMLGLEWADAMVMDCRTLVEAWAEAPGRQDGHLPQAEAVGYALTMLNCYLDYVQIKDMAWPQLLVPAMNRVRSALGKAVLGDDLFLTDIPLRPGLAGVRKPVPDSQRQLMFRRARHVFQIGLLGVIKDSNDPGHLMMMQMALRKLMLVMTEQTLADLLMVLAAAVESLATGVAITPQRKRWLAQVERMLSALIQGKVPQESQWLPTALYLTALGSSGVTGNQIRASYALSERVLNQERLTAEYDIMCGPGSSVIKTVSSVIAEEMAQIRDSLDLMARGVSRMGETEPMDQQIRRLSRTLLMLGQHEISQRTAYWADVVARWTGEPSEDDLNGLVDVLLAVENAMTRLLKDVTPGMDAPVINQNISIHQLDQARTLLVAESRSGMSIAKRGITAYMEANWDVLQLENVVPTLVSVAGGLDFLGVPRGAWVLRQIGHFVDQRLQHLQGEPSVEVMDLLADALSSVDYFLESMEANKPMGDSILLLAEDSVREMFQLSRMELAAP